MQFASEFKSALALVVILLFFVSGYYIFATQYYDMRISDLVKKIESQATDKGLVVKSRKSKDKVADKTLSSLKKIVDSAKSKMGDGGASALNADPVILMNDLVSALPPKSEVNFEVREFVFADNFLRLNATTNDTLNVEKITAALKQSGLFGTIEAGDAQAKPNNRWDFTLKIYLASAANDGES